MLTRRAVASMLAGVAAVPSGAWSASPRSGAVFYNAVGPDLTCWHADIGNAALARQGSVTAPALIQYVWQNPAKPVLYVASSNSVPFDKPDGKHHFTAFRIDPASGALSPFGTPVAIRAPSDQHHRGHRGKVAADGLQHTQHHDRPSARSGRRDRSGDQAGSQHRGRHLRASDQDDAVRQGTGAGHARQQRDHGEGRRSGRTEGQGTEERTTDRHRVHRARRRLRVRTAAVDMHPAKPWMFVSVERQNQLQMYRLRGDNLEPAPAYVVTTLNEPGNLRPEQMVGPIHIHPNGRFVYVGNRASGLIEGQGKKYAAGGENTIAVFAINQTSGEPRLLQAIDTHGFHPRTFSIDPTGRMLVVANLLELPVHVTATGSSRQPCQPIRSAPMAI